MNTTLTSAISQLIFGTLFLLAVVTAQAQTSAPAGGQDSALVKYLGEQDDMMTFNVAYKNPTGAPFTVIITDQDRNQLYQGTFKDKQFYKQFRFPKAEKDKITFTIHNAKDADIAKTFEININSRYIADVAVKKLN
jgi:hypothetical protein